MSRLLVAAAAWKFLSVDGFVPLQQPLSLQRLQSPSPRIVGVQGFSPVQSSSMKQHLRPSPLATTMNEDNEDTMNDALFREDSGLTRETMINTSPSSSTPSIYQEVPDDPLGRHLKMLIASTLPWYAFAAFEMNMFPKAEFFGLTSTEISTLGSFVMLSQFGVYYGCLRLGKATTLVEAQMLVCIMTFICIPADVIGTLYVPTGSLGVTVVAFAAVTTAFGTFLAHYLRKAAFREIPPTTTEHHTLFAENMNEDNTTGPVATTHEHAESIWATLREYRPPPHPSSTQLAMEFTRGFVSFTISVSALGTFFAEGHDPDFWIVASLLSVLVHTSVECVLATTFPGVELEEFDSYLVAESALYAVHMVATTIVSHEEGFGDTLVDQILWSWLFGSATGKLLDRLGKLLGKVDFDAKIGLSKFV